MFTQFTLFLAQATIDSAFDNIIILLGKILLLVGLVMLIWAALLAHDGKIRETVYAIIGAFILAIAVPLLKLIFSIGGGWTP